MSSTTDERLEYLGRVVRSLLRSAEEKWRRLLSSEQCVKILTVGFLDLQETGAVFITESSEGTLSLSTDAIPNLQSQKVVFCLKVVEDQVAVDNMKEAVVCGSLLSDVLGQLSVFIKQGMVQTLCNPEHHEGRQRHLVSDLLPRVRSLSNLVDVVAAQSRGYTALPLPLMPPAPTEQPSSSTGWLKEVINVLEYVASVWIQQMEDALAVTIPEEDLLHVEPRDLAAFWTKQFKSLNIIRKQLLSENIMMIMKILRKTRSRCSLALRALTIKIFEGANDAKTIHDELMPFVKITKKLESKDMPRITKIIPTLIHTIACFWTKCCSLEASNATGVTVIVLISTVNMFIRLSQQYLNGSTLFREDLDDGEQKINIVLTGVCCLTVWYQRCKKEAFIEKLPTPNLKIWDFKDERFLWRLKAFYDRLTAVKEIFKTAIQFLKLEKIEVGGIRGDEAKKLINSVFHEFQEEMVVFDKCSYDILMPEVKEFGRDVVQFHKKVVDLECRVVSVIVMRIKECCDIKSMVKILQLFSFILSRPGILDNVVRATESLIIATANAEINRMSGIFYAETANMKEPLLAGDLPLKAYSSLPAASHIIQWTRDLIYFSTETADAINCVMSLLHSQEGLMNLREKHRMAVETYTEFSDKVFSEWKNLVPGVLSKTLKQPLISRNYVGEITIGFSHQELKTLILDISHMRHLRKLEEIPEVAMSVYQMRDRISAEKNVLEKVVKLYNSLKRRVLPVEFPLLEPHIMQVDELLKEGESCLNWESEGTMEYLQNLSKVVDMLYSKAEKTKENLKIIQSVATSWGKTCIFDDSNSQLEKRYFRRASSYRSATFCRNVQARIKEDGVRIHCLLQENMELFEAEAYCEGWISYLSFIDERVCIALYEFVRRNLQSFLQKTDSTITHQVPFLEAEVDIVDRKLSFISFGNVSNGDCIENFKKGFDSIVTSIFDVVSVVERVSKQQPYPSYLAELQHLQDLNDMQEELKKRTADVVKAIQDMMFGLQSYSYLWQESEENVIQALITTSGKAGSPLSLLSQVKEQISSCTSLHNKIDTCISPSVTLCNWLIVSHIPFKHSLVCLVTKWNLCFMEYLEKSVNLEIEELEEFLQKTEGKLGLQEGEDDLPTEKLSESQSLADMMSHVLSVSDRKTAVDQIFETIMEAIEIISGEIKTTETRKKVSALHEKWKSLKKAVERFHRQMSPFLAQEASNIRNEVVHLSDKQIQFRRRFLQSEVFDRRCAKHVDALMLELEHEIKALKQETEALESRARLFEVHLPESTQLNQCNAELSLLRELWNYNSEVQQHMSSWEETTWTELDFDALEMKCKGWMRDIKAFSKEVREWDCFSMLHDSVRNMLVSLRAIQQLRNPAVCERHWKLLMMTAEVSVDISHGKQATLKELLRLELHKYEDLVQNIVEKASKEAAMERSLKEIESVWMDLKFETEIDSRSGRKLLHISEHVVEILEDDQVKLQNLLCSKHVEYFFGELNLWQRRLSDVESLVTKFIEVQRCWLQMEMIFKVSEDIQCQLPDDCKRFDSLDAEFEKLVNEISTGGKTLITLASQEAHHEKLSALRDELELCEKALAQYIEAKRKLFPRFYFVSSADILDILSCGSQPKLVVRHLPKIFDTVSGLSFSEGRDLYATTVHSRDGEHLTLADSGCSCKGAVEEWLSHLQSSICKTLKSIMAEAVQSYEDRLREQWIFEYPAQVVLCVSQIWWVAEVLSAINRIRQGHDTALKEYCKKQAGQLNCLISMLHGNMSPENRRKVMTLCTLDVHSRDVVSQLISQKVDRTTDFTWQSQLRPRWDRETCVCKVDICDTCFDYGYEYLGNVARLVITPLTDRCFITLTQSLHLKMGGAPTGPAGTGKTETVKDLGKALGILVYVFNCSEQMDYKSCAAVYKGLAQAGAWGCFDEFNRIALEVLSVVAVQVKCIQDALKQSKETFYFIGEEEITLKPSTGIFITMNPGYAGRTELPENLKSLFRPCAMVTPDCQLISEILLVAEGFLDAKTLSCKLTTLYSLCERLLSKRHHYDWGLRNIKAVLLVAGHRKRARPTAPEDAVLMHALKDFILPKLVSEDIPVFYGILSDLFPAVEDVPVKKTEREDSVRKSARMLGLQPEEAFILKVLQLEDLLETCHSVFIVGGAGSGKTSVWKTLFQTYKNSADLVPVVHDLDPKAVSCDELYGTVNPSTMEWKDGLLSSLLRSLVSSTVQGPKWLVLDGDIDPVWIESLNSVMDDNRVLTLASGERITLTPMVRLIFETGSLREATPATVSRGGVLHMNSSDLGWNPYAISWIEHKSLQSEKSNLMLLFDKYVPACLEAITRRFKSVILMPDIYYVQMLCSLLDCFLTPDHIPENSPKELYELYFVFCCIWSFGSCLIQDQSAVTQREEFSKWFISEFRTVKFPISGNEDTSTVFDFYPGNKRWFPWSRKMPKFEVGNYTLLKEAFVPTIDTFRLEYFTQLLAESGNSVMLVGSDGCGKSAVAQSAVSKLNSDAFQVVRLPVSYYTVGETVQKMLESYLEKKAGKMYGPKGQRKLVYCIDDFSVVQVDTHGTFQAHTIIRQHLHHGHWYDRQKLCLKEIRNCQYIVTMSPTSGQFHVDERLQRHFCTLSVPTASSETLKTIFGTLLQGHLIKIHPEEHSLDRELKQMVQLVTNSAVALHQKMVSSFLPTAAKFHYSFNMRDFLNVVKGLLMGNADSFCSDQDLLKFWLHESFRAYGDKMASREDAERYEKIVLDILKRHMDLDEQTCNSLLNRMPIYCHFVQGVGTSGYQQANDRAQLRRVAQDALDAYNDIYPPMDLVLFDDALQHLCRVSRILESGSHALFVGVGGCGKRSLASLAAYLGNLQLYQISLHSEYTVQDFKNELATVYMRAGLKNIGTLFLLSDTHLIDEKFLIPLNNFLTAGDVADVFSHSDIEDVMSSIRSEVKAAGILDSKENCWKFFVNKVKAKLRIVFCFSPAGSTLRSRCSRFPGLLSCTSMDWCHTWSKQAMLAVSEKLLSDLPVLKDNLKGSASEFAAFAYSSVQDANAALKINEKRNCDVTPRSFLEHLKMYKGLLVSKHSNLRERVQRFRSGLKKLVDTSHEVDKLKHKLAEQEVELMQRKEETDTLLDTIGKDTELAVQERSLAAEEERKVSVMNEQVLQRRKDCEDDLSKAEPALVAAKEALNTLNKANLTELRSFGAPPPAVRNVTAAVMTLLAQDGRNPRDLSWRAAKLMMAKLDAFLDSLINFDKQNIHENTIKALQSYLKSPEFKPEVVGAKSQAAAGLCSWVINVLKYYEVYCEVEPKRHALAQANAEYKAAKEKLDQVQQKVQMLEERLSSLTTEYNEAVCEKNRCETEAHETTFNIELANRLLKGLASERERWSQLVELYGKREESLPGDVLLSSAFVSYLGPFPKHYRFQLLQKQWTEYLLNKTEIPVDVCDDECSVDPLPLLLHNEDHTVAEWKQWGLPGDRVSLENAAIFSEACEHRRWPFVVDPQVQAVPWIKNMFSRNLLVLNTHARGYMNLLEEAITSGRVVLIENLKEEIDPALQPVIMCNLVKKGKFLKIGSKEIGFHPDFSLILHTRLSNPHFRPEIQAQTTVINFSVTLDGLADQLLAEVVFKEKPELENDKMSITSKRNEYAIQLRKLEDSLLTRLSSAEGQLVGDVTLVENLEETKKTAEEVHFKALEATKTEALINDAREAYRPVALRAALCYFGVKDLENLNSIYIFSLKAFKDVFHRAIETCEPSDENDRRIQLLVQHSTERIFRYIERGLFEKDKLVFATHLTFQVMQRSGKISPHEVEFLLHPSSADCNVDSPVDFISSCSWAAIRNLSSLDGFCGLEHDIESAPKRWKKILESPCPEQESFPHEWNEVTSTAQKLCILKCLRPDRMINALRAFVHENLGPAFASSHRFDFRSILEEFDGHTPILFVQGPGTDPLAELENFSPKANDTDKPGNVHVVSLGQGQEAVAERAVRTGMAKGHWVMLQNIHLVQKWLPDLEALLEEILLSSALHPSFRLFLSMSPPESSSHLSPVVIPPGILEMCLKVVNEPPKGLRENILRAMDNFDQETIESCSREMEFRSLLFSLCFFHALCVERKKFGPLGWNALYPFSNSDLLISASVLYNYLEKCEGNNIPFNDLIYLLGEVLYGGHVTDDHDRKLCSAYLRQFFNYEQLEADAVLCPGFGVPPFVELDQCYSYVEQHFPDETPLIFGLHDNAEIGYLIDSSFQLLDSLQELQSVLEKSGQQQANVIGIIATSATPMEEKALQVAEDIEDKLPEPFPVAELYAKCDPSVPFVAVGLQECQVFNDLLSAVRQSLLDLTRAMKGEIPMCSEIESLSEALVSDMVPQSWALRSYPPVTPLGTWYGHFLRRHKALLNWVSLDFCLAPTVWLGGLFSPQSFLTAVMQTGARSHELPLDKLSLQVEVTKKCAEDITHAPKEGAFITDLFIEGAQWDSAKGCITESHEKELYPSVPVVYIRPILTDKLDTRNCYPCPVYATKQRGSTYVWEFLLPMSGKSDKWTIAGVALLLNV